MTNPQVQNDSVIAVSPYLYKNGMIISNDATTPNTVLDIAQGQCRDSSNMIDMGIGSNYVVPYQGVAVSTPLLLNAAINGVNGLDTGSLAASTMYAVYIIGDSRSRNPTASILTLQTNSSPLMPLGYDSYRLIGYWATDSMSHFLTGYYSSNSTGGLDFFYDAPQATAVTAGAATSYTAVTLDTLVPLVNNVVVKVYTVYDPGTAGDTLKMQGLKSTGDAVTITGQVMSVNVTSISNVLGQLTTSGTLHVQINYKVTTGDTVAINVAGFSVGV